MNANLKRVAIVLAFVSLGTAGLTTTGQAKTTWHKGVPKAIRGVWVAPNGKKQNLNDMGPVYAYKMTSKSIDPLFNKSELKDPDASSKVSYRYHHKKGSKYYYTKSPLFYTRFGTIVEYTWFKLDGKKLSASRYGEVRTEILDNGKKVQPYGKYHKVSKHVTTWYKN